MSALEKGTKFIVFPSLPNTLAEFTVLPQAALQSPYDTAALFAAALGAYIKDKGEFIIMVQL